MSKLNWGMKACGVLLLWAIAAIGLPGQIPAISTSPPLFSVLHSFDDTDGEYPYAGLTQGADGTLYGTTFQGGEQGWGTVFTLTPGGQLTTLYSFCSQGGDECTDGALPSTSLLQDTDGNFYGTTSNGGSGHNNDQGTVFKITPSGKLTTLYSFCSDYDSQTEECLDGAKPSTLLRGVDGNLYGTTGAGGAGDNDDGTVFKITPNGKLTTLYSFCSQGGDQCPDGIGPEAGLVQSTDGNFYGTTSKGGSNAGTIFSITPSGKLTTLYTFEDTCGDGCSPEAALIQGADGNFYGTTSMGGANGGGGTVFRIAPDGQMTTVYNFCSQRSNGACSDGESPVAGLVQATDGNFYGTTEFGGVAHSGGACGYGCGTVFQLTTTGELTTLYDFCSQGGNLCTDGLQPMAGLVQDTDGTFYGTAAAGGTSYLGVVFHLSTGLGPFVETNPAAGKVGKKVGILGTNLTGATSVTFHGVPADFKVRSQTLIVAEVPSGATTGTVQVQLPSGALSSNVPFVVLK